MKLNPHPERKSGLSRGQIIALIGIGITAISVVLQFLGGGRTPTIKVSPQPTPIIQQVILHENHTVCQRVVIAVGAGSFHRTFEDGNLHFELGNSEKAYILYDGSGPSKRTLGKLTIPDDTYKGVILIQIDQQSAFWQPS